MKSAYAGRNGIFVAVLSTVTFFLSRETHKECAVSDCVFVSGIIDQESYSTLSEGKNEVRTLIINSRGGSALFALKIAKYIIENDLELLVIDDCSSACAEYILPAARRVNFKNSPVLAFHGNLLAYNELGAVPDNYPILSLTHCLICDNWRLGSELLKRHSHSFKNSTKLSLGTPLNLRK